MKRLLAILLLCTSLAHAQTPVTLAPVAKQQFFSAAGVPLAGGAVYTFQAGTTTPLATYSEFTGTIPNTNPIILDAGGYPQPGPIFLSNTSYKFVLCAAGSGGSGTCAAFGPQQWVIDDILPPLFPGGNNTFSGGNTFNGVTTFNAAVVLSGGSMTGTYTGNPTFSGNPQVTGTFTTTSALAAQGGVNTDTINGTITTGGTLQLTGANGTAANPGEAIGLTAGSGTGAGANGGAIIEAGGVGITTGNGGGVQLVGGNAPASGHGGQVNISGGISTSGNGGGVTIQGGNGQASGGSPVTIIGGGGLSGGNGSDVTLGGGAGGGGGQNGSVVLTQDGRLKFTVSPTAVAPTCASTGLGGAGTCTLANYSTDTSGQIILTAAAGAAATGTITLTFKQTMGANGSFCMYSLAQNGTGTYTQPATIMTGVGGSASNNAVWTNGGATALTATFTYDVNYLCRGEN